MRRYFLFILLSFFAGHMFAQTNEIHGIVFDNNSTEILAGASITIFHAGEITGLVANKEGKFMIASGTMFDSVRVSMVGHYSKTFTYERFNHLYALFEIMLEPATAQLQEVYLKALTAKDVLKKAITNISSNQPDHNFENKGFYREIIKDRENYFSVAEAVFQAQYFPSAKNYKLI
jgi:hypothetical protein